MARRFPPTLRVPQLGWNTVLPPASTGPADRVDGEPLVTRGDAYFANSYRFVLAAPPPGWRGGEGCWMWAPASAARRG